MTKLEGIARELDRAVSDLRFGPPVTHVYNPLDYARRPHEAYLRGFGDGTREVLFLGMNPGPFGMAQTGVPFGEVSAVRDWMGIDSEVGRPDPEHPRRPVLGFACTRSEVSGRRLWGWARDRFGAAERFFSRHFVWNYCPLLFLEESGRNRTPNRLPMSERAPLFEVCDRALVQVVAALQPRWLVAVGGFAEGRARAALAEGDGARKVPHGEGRGRVVQDSEAGLMICRIPHPSPANPAANRGWAEQAEACLREAGVQEP